MTLKLLTPEDYETMVDDAFAFQSRRLLNRIIGGYMTTFKLTVIQVTRIEVEVKAETDIQAKAEWKKGTAIKLDTLSTDIIDCQKVA